VSDILLLALRDDLTSSRALLSKLRGDPTYLLRELSAFVKEEKRKAFRVSWKALAGSLASE
jgi:hypothetical protein